MNYDKRCCEVPWVNESETKKKSVISIESAPFNKGKNKIYVGVPGNLVAFLSKVSWDKGYEGFVSFISKTRLIEHYEKTLGATHVGNHKMVIFPKEALNLIKKYFKI